VVFFDHHNYMRKRGLVGGHGSLDWGGGSSASAGDSKSCEKAKRKQGNEGGCAGGFERANHSGSFRPEVVLAPAAADNWLFLGGFALLDVVLFGSDFEMFVLDIEAEAIVNAHVLVGHPDQGEEGDEISAPAGVEHVEAGDYQEYGGDVVAETVFADEKIKKLAPGERMGRVRLALTIFAGLAEDLFVRDGPGNASNGYSQHQEPGELDSKRNRENGHGASVGCGTGLRGVET